MDAIQYLTQQHREIEDLFEDFESAGRTAQMEKLHPCRKISDLLAAHVAT